jgi:tryptophan-rich sensory protein
MYTLMGAAVFLVWQDNGVSQVLPLYNGSIAVWVVMLVVNALWTPLFFGMRMLRLALADLVLHLLLAIAVVVLFFMQNWVAGALMIPLCLWLVFALYLNAYIVATSSRK